MRRLVALSFLIFFSGCGSTSFVGSRYDDFTAFYNTFYNAERAFKKGVEATRGRTGPVDREVLSPVFPVFDSPSTAREFEEAIRKSADVLRDHGGSKWVDDALLLIGKSYYYQQNYVAAEEKFREVVVLGTKREDEARYWLARTLLADNSYDALRDHLVVTFEREKISKKWNPFLVLVQGELFVRQGQLENAIEPLSLGARSVKDRKLGTRAHYLLGQIHESLGQYEQAIANYKRAQRKNSDFDLVYASRVSIIRAESAAGDVELALRDLRKMERDDKNFDQVADLRALRGRILLDNGEVEEAGLMFEDILRSEDRVSPAVKGDIHYRLASVNRDVYLDFRAAAAHFDTASTSLQVLIDKRQLDGQKFGFADPFVPWAIKDAREQKEVFGTFASIAADVADMDSLLYLGSLDDEAFTVRIDEIRRQRREELSALARQQQQRQIEEQFRNGGGGDTRQNVNGNTKVIGDQRSQTSENSESGFLYHKDPARVQDGLRNFVALWGERPPVPGWRLSSKLLAASSSTSEIPDKRLASAKRAVGKLIGSDSFGNEFDDVDVERVPRTEEAIAAMRTKRAESRYQVGTVLFLSMNRPDSAAAWFRKVITDDPDQPIAPKAYYALAEVNSALGDHERSDELRKTLAEKFPDHGSGDEEEIEEQRIAELTGMAEAKYADLYDAWQNDQYPTAAAGLLVLAEDVQPTAVAPQALYAAGSVLMDWAATDSRSILDPVPLPLPDSVASWLGVALPEDSTAAAVPDTASFDVAGENQSAVDSTIVPTSDSDIGEDSLDSADNGRGEEQGAPAAIDSVSVKEKQPVGEDNSSEAITDSVLTVVVDSTGLAGQLIAPGDSAAVARDSTGAGLQGAVPDSIVVVENMPGVDVSIESVLNLLTSSYNDTEYAVLARKQLELIGELRAEAQAIEDSIAAVKAAVEDSLANVALAAAPDSVIADSTIADVAIADSSLADSTLADSVAIDFAAVDSIVIDSTAIVSTAEVTAAHADTVSMPADVVYASGELDSEPTPEGGVQSISSDVVAPDSVAAAGFADLELVVGKDGRARDITVVFAVVADRNAAIDESLDPAMEAAIKQAVIDAVLRARFTPGQKAGVSVSSKIRLKVPLGAN